MNVIIDIETARTLLDRFYAGETTPDEQAALDRFFEARLGSLPEDMEADARMFAAMRSVDSFLPAPPADLERRLEASIAPPRKRRLRLVRAIASVAASVAVALIAVDGLRGSVDLSIPALPVPKEMIAAVKTPAPDINVDSDEAPIAHAEKPAAERRPAKPKPKPRRSPAPAPDDNFREITDPAEAERILADVVGLMSKNFGTATEAINFSASTANEAFKFVKQEIL